MKTFFELYSEGNAKLDEIDDFIDKWHGSELTISLHEYLGMSWEEYSLWISNKKELSDIFSNKG